MWLRLVTSSAHTVQTLKYRAHYIVHSSAICQCQTGTAREAPSAFVVVWLTVLGAVLWVNGAMVAEKFSDFVEGVGSASRTKASRMSTKRSSPSENISSLSSSLSTSRIWKMTSFMASSSASEELASAVTILVEITQCFILQSLLRGVHIGEMPCSRY